MGKNGSKAPARIRQGQRKFVRALLKNDGHIPSNPDLAQGCGPDHEELPGWKIFQGSRTVNVGSNPLALTILNQLQKQ